jgi:hypothetical protein
MDRDELSGLVRTWVTGGLISAGQGARILAHAANGPGTTAPGDPGPRASAPSGTAVGADASRQAGPDRRARVAEVVGYVGASFALGAIALLLTEVWDRFDPWGRLAFTLLLTVTLVAAGAALGGRPGTPLRRLTAVLWLASVATTAWTAGVVVMDLVDLPSRWVPTFVAGSALVVATVLLAASRLVVLQFAALVTLLVTGGTAVAALTRLPLGALATGVLLAGAGVAWGLAGSGGWLGPRWSAEAAGGAIALIGVFATRFGPAPRASLAVGVVLAAGIVGLSLPGQRIHLLFVGAAGLFVLMPQLVFTLFADTLGAPATLLATGVLLILLATGLGRVRRAGVASGDDREVSLA